MSRPSLSAACLLLTVVAGAGFAQCGGNDANADLRSSPQAIGTTVTFSIEGGAGEFFALYVSDGTLPIAVPGVGVVCLDILSPAFDDLLQGTIPPTGVFDLPVVVPNDPALLSLLLFLQAVVVDPSAPSGIGLSQALRVDFENADAYAALPTLPAARALATGNRLGDGRMLVAGGGSGTLLAPAGTATCDLYDPLTRSVSAGPNMAFNRALHTGTTLADGRVLVCGGVVDAAGTITSSCEIFTPGTGLPLTDAWSFAASMSTARAGHTATLLDDGRVLVTGGATSFVGTIAMILGSALNTGEVYDPVTNTWTPVTNTMASPRFAAAAVRRNDGRVLVTSGISGATSIIFVGDVPTWTSSCNHYDPMTNSFGGAPSVPTGVAGHVMGVLPGGDVWLAGGAVSVLFVPTATDATRRLAGAGWTTGPTLPTAVVLPGLVTLQSGALQLFGGATGTLLAPGAAADVVRFDGVVQTPKAPLPVARGVAVTVVQEDGSVFIAGGADNSGTAIDTALLYTPDP